MQKNNPIRVIFIFLRLTSTGGQARELHYKRYCPYTCRRHVSSCYLSRPHALTEAANRLPLIPRASIAADQRHCVAVTTFGCMRTPGTKPLHPECAFAIFQYRDAPPSRDVILAGWRAPATLRSSEGAAKNLGPATHLFRGTTFGRRTPGDEVCGLDGSS